MKNNKKLFAGLLAMSCAFVMSACDPVVATPTKINDKIVSGQHTDVADNFVGKLWDAVSGDQNSKVIQDILDEIAKQKFGTYKEIMDALESLEGDKELAKKYVNTDHAEFFKGANDDISLQRFEIFAKDVKDKVNAAFYDLINNSEYKDPVTEKFDESLLYDDLKVQLYDLNKLASGDKYKTFFVTPEITKENALEHLNGYLYSNATKPADAPEKYAVRGYIETEILPDILKDKLVEKYILNLNENYSMIGRAYARKVNFINVPYTTENSKFVKSVVEDFVKNEIYDKEANELDFDVIDDAIRGFSKIDHDNESWLLDLTNAGGFVRVNNADTTYATSYQQKYSVSDMVVIEITDSNKEYFDGVFKNLTSGLKLSFYKFTELGKLMDDYSKAILGDLNGGIATDEQKTALGKFNGKDTLAESLRDQIIGLAKSDHTTNDWFVNNGSMPDMPLKDRLFSNNMASNFGKFVEEHKNPTADQHALGDYRYKNGKQADGELKRTPFARNINGKTFVMPANPDSFADNKDNFVYDNDTSLTICQVLEAPNAPKLNKNGKDAYKKADGSVDVLKIEEVAREITKILSTKDSYINDAYTSYLDGFTFQFSDTSFKEYLQGQYPDLAIFEE